MKILFVCTSNKDRSPALEKHFREKYPQHEYRSAGINRFFTTQNGTHLIEREDVDWCDYVICAERIHYDFIFRHIITDFGKPYIILNAGDYEKGDMDDYVLVAESKIKTHIKIDTFKNAPQKIFLQVGDDCPDDENFVDLFGVSWCAEKINENDLEYILKTRT